MELYKLCDANKMLQGHRTGGSWIHKYCSNEHTQEIPLTCQGGLYLDLHEAPIRTVSFIHLVFDDWGSTASTSPEIISSVIGIMTLWCWLKRQLCCAAQLVTRSSRKVKVSWFIKPVLDMNPLLVEPLKFSEGSRKYKIHKNINPDIMRKQGYRRDQNKTGGEDDLVRTKENQAVYLQAGDD